MTEQPPTLARLSRPRQWCVLIAASTGLAILLSLAGLPASLLLGPMIAAILLGVDGGALRIPNAAQNAAQAVIGCMIAGSITSDIVATVWKEWPLCLGVVISTIVASSFLGWVIGRSQLIPGSTAVWGLSPGGAMVMVLMAEECGADGRLVAFMQYLRVGLVAGAAALVARFWVDPSAAAAPRADWFPATHWLAFAATLAIAAVGALLGRLSRIPGGLILGPMFLGAVLHASGATPIELPPWLLVASYAINGWRIGLAFTRPILLHATRTLPQTLLSTLALIALCGGLAVLMATALGVDPLTAYLATSPGGVDSVAIIAASTKVDLPFIMALQIMRVVIVLLLGPPIARFVARRVEEEPPRPDAERSSALEPLGDSSAELSQNRGDRSPVAEAGRGA